MNVRFLEEKRTYHGPELRPHYLLQTTGIEGDALVAFLGACDVKTDHLVDWEDRLQNDSIRAKEMVHFLGEFFGITLKEGIWIQRLLVSEWQALLLRDGIAAIREGDDLFIDGEKLSVSIVTASPVSVLLHLGINVDPEGAPVRAVGLKNWYPTPEKVALAVETILNRFNDEYRSVARAAVKVRPVI